MPVIRHYHAFEGVYNSFIYFRNFGYHDLSDSLYKSLQSFKLSEYDQQKISLSYFNSLLGSHSRINQIGSQVDDFLKDHKDKIIAYGHHGCHPWVNLFYNMTNVERAGVIELSDYLRSCIVELEKRFIRKRLQK